MLLFTLAGVSIPNSLKDCFSLSPKEITFCWSLNEDLRFEVKEFFLSNQS